MTHHQAALPPGWNLADEATLPGGKSISGTAARVYNLLHETRRRGYRWKVGRHLAPAGWVPTWVLREPWAGGAAGDRRLRDLREAGVDIESLRFTPPGDAPTSASWLWRLAPPDPGARRPMALAQPIESPPCEASAGTPLYGIAIHFVTRETSGAIDISPGASSPLAPSLGARDDEAYRRELLEAFHAGRLVSCLKAHTEWHLWADSAAAYDPRPVLQSALSKLGASLGA